MLGPTVKDILRSKSHSTVWTISPQESVYLALKRMAKHSIGALVVVDGGEVVGILSERDYARKVILVDRRSKETTVSEIMARGVPDVGPECPLEQCMQIMTSDCVRHLPVFQFKKLVGIVSIGDVVKALIEDQEFLIEQLTSYVTGSHSPVRRLLRENE